MAMKDHLIHSGIDHYIAGRFAARAGLMPACGNLMHHALEFMLKGLLVDRIPVAQLRRRFSHDLPALWNEYKGTSVALARFDQLIGDLHQFEDIRYPETLEAEGGSILTSWLRRRDDLRSHPALQTTPVYEVVIHIIDELMLALLDEEIGADTWPHLRTYSRTAIDTLTYNNPYASRWADLCGDDDRHDADEGDDSSPET